MDATTEALVILIAIIVIAYTCIALLLQWWSGELDEPERGPDMQEGWRDDA